MSTAYELALKYKNDDAKLYKTNPQRPRKPQFSHAMTSQTALLYAKELEAWEKENNEYLEHATRIKEQRTELFVNYKKELFGMFLSPDLNEKALELLYDFSYAESHSNGFTEVAETFESMVDLFEDVIRTSKKILKT